MEQFNRMTQMLQLIDHPAFCVKDGKIIAVNSHAQQLLIHTGTEIAPLLRTGHQEYTELQDGCLYLTIAVGNDAVGTSVHKIDGFDIFVVEQESDLAQLQTMALAAQELRRPLSSVMTVADRLFPMLSEQEDDRTQEQLSRINRGLFQMLRVISNMSDAFRYTQDAAPVQELRDISGIFGEVFLKAEALVQHTGVALHFTNLNERVYTLVDTEKIERAVYNILSNAIKFTPAGGTITAEAHRKKDMIYLTVHDTGTGIAPELRGDTFTRYLRSPGIEEGRFGIGLGMVLIRSAAAQHGGTVLLDRKDGIGNRITLTLQIRQDTGGQLNSPVLHVDYTGERDHALVELSDALPAQAYRNDHIR